jgi:exonuclease I
MAKKGIQKMSQKSEEELEDRAPPGKDNQITNLLFHYVHRS